MRFGFIDGTYPDRARVAEAQRTINLLPHLMQSGKAVNEMVLLRTPGLSVFTELEDSPNRALFAEDGRVFSVNGSSFYELFANGTFVRYGSVAEDADPATIVSNGETTGGQLLITSGGKAYIFDLAAGSLTETMPTVAHAHMGAFVDGYFIVLDRSANQFQLSALADGSTWDPLDIATRNFASDRILAIWADQRELWLYGSKKSEVWYNSGDRDFPFQPITGTFIENGIVAPFSPARAANTTLWLGGSERGTGVCLGAEGYTPKRVSTHAEEYQWQRLSRIDDAIGFSYQEEGHTFYCLYLPAAETTWVYDVTTNRWHERALWNPDRLCFEPHLARSHAAVFGKHLVGDRQSGAIYDQSLAYLEDSVIYD